MKKKNNIRKNKSGFKTPSDYFESLEDNLFQRLGKDTLQDNDKSTAFKVPKDYFDSLEQELSVRLEKEKEIEASKIKSLFNWKKAAVLTGIAASIIIIFNLNLGNNANIDFNDIKISSIESYLMDENISAYEIAQTLNLEDISFPDTEVQLSDSEIEDYLLDNTKIEELIIE